MLDFASITGRYLRESPITAITRNELVILYNRFQDHLNPFQEGSVQGAQVLEDVGLPDYRQGQAVLERAKLLVTALVSLASLASRPEVGVEALRGVLLARDVLVQAGGPGIGRSSSRHRG